MTIHLVGLARRARLLLPAFVGPVLAACDIGTGPEPVELSVTPEAGLVVGVGGTTHFVVSAPEPAGDGFGVDGAEWTSADPSIATVDGRGMATGVGEGITELTVRLGGLSATASLEVYEPPAVATYQPGVTYFGRRGYVEYMPGELPVVVSAPHGGSWTPSEIADRTFGTTVTDTNTRELTLAVRDALMDLTGRAPHVVISRLDRVKLDPNRDIAEAAQGDPFAGRAWEEYHAFIEIARATVSGMGGGMYFDVHGHGHPVDRLELGYLLSAEQLDRDDDQLNSLAVVQQTSIRDLGLRSTVPFAQLVRGPTSLGGLLNDAGVAAVPTPSTPSPGDDPYFSGGYSTRRHGSRDESELVSAVQIEHHFPGLRDSDANRRGYATRLARVIRSFMLEHFGYFEP